jgi:hypothetical protein
VPSSFFSKHSNKSCTHAHALIAMRAPTCVSCTLAHRALFGSCSSARARRLRVNVGEGGCWSGISRGYHASSSQDLHRAERARSARRCICLMSSHCLAALQLSNENIRLRICN